MEPARLAQLLLRALDHRSSTVRGIFTDADAWWDGGVWCTCRTEPGELVVRTAKESNATEMVVSRAALAVCATDGGVDVGLRGWDVAVADTILLRRTNASVCWGRGVGMSVALHSGAVMVGAMVVVVGIEIV
jgi:hypothetical protein